MLVLPELISTSNAISVHTLRGFLFDFCFFVETDKLFVKLIWTYKDSRITRKSWRKKIKGLRLTDFKTYYKSTQRSIGTGINKLMSEILYEVQKHSCSYMVTWITTKTQLQFNVTRLIFKSMILEGLDICMAKHKSWYLPHIPTKIHWRCIMGQDAKG